MKTRLLWLVALPLVVACGSESDSADPGDRDAPDPAPAGSRDGEAMESPGDDEAGSAAGNSGPATDPGMPFGPDADFFAWSTDEFSLEAGQERYLCFAATLAEDLVVDGYNSDADGFVHHVIFSRARAPEPEGFAECDIAFRNTWDPVFITGAGDTTLEFPAGAGHKLTQGTQMVVQMHLLNLAEEPVSGSLTGRRPRWWARARRSSPCS